MARERSLNTPGSWSLIIGGVVLLVAILNFEAERHKAPSRASDPQLGHGSLDHAGSVPTEPHIQAGYTPTTPGFGQSSQEAIFEIYRVRLLQSVFGKCRIEELLQALVETSGGPEIQLIFQALALRKQEALPIIRARLLTGQTWEKHMITKFLRVCPWQETKEELYAMVRSRKEHWLPKQGAVFALGALGDSSVGPAVAALLESPDSGVNLQMAAVSTLSRIRFLESKPVMERFAHASNLHLRLFAMRALAELGESVDRDFLLSCLKSEDYVVRQEASETLWAVRDPEVVEALRWVAKGDANEAVRDAASQALLRRQLSGRSASEKIEVLREALANAERLTALWILRTLLEQGGGEGRSIVLQVAGRSDFLGERSRAYLVLASANTAAGVK